MPRTARASVGGMIYHVLNRGNARQQVFHKPHDYAAFIKLLKEANDNVRCAPMRLLGYCLMPNHFHLVLWPREDGDLGTWMQWLLTAHVRRYHRHYGSDGHVWQGRFKAFPVQGDEHYFTLLRYVERNPLRAVSLGINRAEDWQWSSIGSTPAYFERPLLDPGPIPRRADWLQWVNMPLTNAELEAVRRCIDREAPFGDEEWQRRTAEQLGLEQTLRPRGRPRKRGHSTF